MVCDDGFLSYPKADSPERFTVETGVICSTFGIQSPLCKWADEILPTLPVPEELKQMGKRFAKKLREKIGAKAYQNLSETIRDFSLFSQIYRDVERVNDLIDDVAQTIAGGEIGTLEFCLAGVPELPENVNFGDVFLAYSGLYPEFLIDKMSSVYAYEKYFELCECRRATALIPPDTTGFEPPIEPNPPFAGVNACEIAMNLRLTQLYQQRTTAYLKMNPDFTLNVLGQDFLSGGEEIISVQSSFLDSVSEPNLTQNPIPFWLNVEGNCCRVLVLDSLITRPYITLGGIVTIKQIDDTERQIWVGSSNLSGISVNDLTLEQFYASSRSFSGCYDEFGEYTPNCFIGTLGGSYLEPILTQTECSTPEPEIPIDDTKDIEPIDPPYDACDEAQIKPDIIKFCCPDSECVESEISIMDRDCDGVETEVILSLLSNEDNPI